MSKYFISDFFCVECGNKGVPLPRKSNQKREKGHLKRIYCPHCKKETNHVEINENSNYCYEDFLSEFQNNNFVNGERVK